MSSKDFAAIAAIFAGYALQPQAKNIVRELAYLFKENNTRFDVDQFITACNTPVNF